ncbi:PREDICTED: DNA topoisomerase 3-alpha [Nicrophorus vespilloides]|uniref:DNA topoisomerase n=1 Tax=Nicrophorus vespilloides TaxID=110193 RepID=A0ABM1MJ63_NICVS|nr:PREDICTED: DNA topoisomerase 3-alpha [Nicrophorus vespilloides]
MRLISYVCKQFSPEVMKYLCVAEKNDAAKNIAKFLSKGTSNRREGLSKFNKIYEFDCQVRGQQSRMVMTSVSGHLLNYEFSSQYRSWNSCNPVLLLDAPVNKFCPENNIKIKKTLEREIRGCNGLIIWTDCDREGENIGMEVVNVCTEVKRNIVVYRAKFSEITGPSVFRALNNLEEPNKNVSDAVNVRQEIDLRTGAAFTRFQTLRYKNVFPNILSDKLVSYGSCQFPTLGFIVDRYLLVQNFIPENFWKIKMNHKVGDLSTDFNWVRERLFSKEAVMMFLDICKDNPVANVENVENKPKNKWRPLPLDTIEMEKNISRKLKITAKETMKVAEKLYTQGFISYPRTETNIFPKELNLRELVEQQTNDNNWGPFANRILEEYGGPNPRQGKKSDQAHPPIHPTKYAENLQGKEKQVYEFIVRHFLACVSQDAVGHETVVHTDVSSEKFTARGLIIIKRNYLDVYIYEKWNAKEINDYKIGDTFTPTVLEMVEGQTSAPNYMTESELIAIMEKNGIGTDATHAEHIETIKSRDYVTLRDNNYFIPTNLGLGLVEGYNQLEMEISLSKPVLRANFEKDLQLICNGVKRPDEVLNDQITKYKEVYQQVMLKVGLIDRTLAQHLNDTPHEYQEPQFQTNTYRSLMKCPRCGSDINLRDMKNGRGKFIGCSGYPGCKYVIWLTFGYSEIEVLDESCNICGPDVKKLKIKFDQNPFLGEPNPNVLCIGGCDPAVLTALNISLTDNSGANNHSRTEAPSSRPAQNNTSFNNARPNQSVGIPNVRPNQSIIPNPPRPTRVVPPRNLPSSDDTIVCNCNEPAVLLTCQNNGPNNGRQFYKCYCNDPSRKCNFFLWAPEEGHGPEPRASAASAEEEEIKCKCAMMAVTKTVQKEGPNKGKQFYTCPKPMGSSCNFFKWVDEDNAAGGSTSYRGRARGRGRGRGGGANHGNRTLSNQPRAPRKCGICGQEGHTRTRCPNK